MIRLSYIIPAYNMEKYLDECILSILNKQFKNSEIILVDDGSTDGTAAICDRYVEEYEFIQVIHKENGGISSARNAGLNKARGKYVCFIDSDDFIKVDFAEKFLDICDINSLDVIRGWYGIYEEKDEVYVEHSFPDITYANKVLDGKQFLNKSISEKANEVVPWLGFFRREYLTEHKLQFPEGIAYEEDQLFFLETLLCDDSCRVYQSDIEFYTYRKRAGSATKTPTLKQVKDILFIVEHETGLIKKYNISGETKKTVLKYICSSFYQLTSIYGRLEKKDAQQAAKLTPFWMKWQCIKYPYDRHQWIKIVLFTYARWFVDYVYRSRKV